MEIGNRLKARRTEKKLSAEYVASKIGVDISTYRKYERDEVSPSLEKLEKIANALEVSIFSLFPDNITVSNNQTGGHSNNALIINQLSEKLIEKYENEITELKADKDYLKAEIKALKEELNLRRQK
jgi:transcriptional regulator with XRE-family HTH domain